MVGKSVHEHLHMVGESVPEDLNMVGKNYLNIYTWLDLERVHLNIYTWLKRVYPKHIHKGAGART
jgi:hypothetical protein